MKKKLARKLTLSTETLRTLDTLEMRKANGGRPTDSQCYTCDYTCPSCYSDNGETC